MKRANSFRNRGSVAALAFVGVVPLIAAIGAFSVDSMHVNDARGALQRATDAAALAGAQDLSNYTGTKRKTATSVSDANEEPVNQSLQLASMNAVDGPLGLWQSRNRTITSTIRYDAALGGVATRPNRCDVDGSILIRSIFAQFFGNFGQTVTTHSSAGYTALNELDGWSPLLVSWTDPDPNGKILNSVNGRTTYTVIIKTNTNSNSVWIVNSGATAKDILAYIGGVGPRPDKMPNYKIGDHVITDNGIKGGAASDFAVLLNKNVAFLVTDDSGVGYLARGRADHIVTRFIAMHVTSVDITNKGDGYNVTGDLIPVAGLGNFIPGSPPNPNNQFAPFEVRLIQ